MTTEFLLGAQRQMQAMLPRASGKQVEKKIPHSSCHSERSEESLFLLLGLNRGAIPRFVRNDKIVYFFRNLKILLLQFALEAILQFRADLGNFHARAHQELAAQEIVRAVLIGEFPDDAAILAILIPAEAPVRDSFRANVLETAQNRILFGDLKRFPHNLDFH
jgi:hypothetical protein